MTETDQLARQAMATMREGRHADARRAFEAVIAAGDAPIEAHILLAQCCAHMGDDAAASATLDGVLRTESRNVAALVMKGDLFARAGDDRAASSWYGMALSSAPTSPSPDVARLLTHAHGQLAAAGQRYRGHLHDALAARGVATAAVHPRFAEALAILAGEKQVYLQSPTSFFYPGLPHRQFFALTDFDWVADYEAAAPAIRTELENVLAANAALRPYVEADPTRPNKGHALLGDPNWSAFYLWENGAPAPGADRCPTAMAALAKLPIPRIAGRSPMALFSVLRPHTHIPPHSGMLNTRLIVHLPLIVPAGCRLRVGNDVRAVEAGKVMIFDDSIEHEAWNDSDETRVVLLTEIWRPELGADERNALTAMFEAIGDYPSA
jgi:aspartyl/asparaginyl beta-hydroxylase (cupin superfamily)